MRVSAHLLEVTRLESDYQPTTFFATPYDCGPVTKEDSTHAGSLGLIPVVGRNTNGSWSLLPDRIGFQIGLQTMISCTIAPICKLKIL